MAELPPTYRVQDGCHNCRKCEIHARQDFTGWFCVADGVASPDAPKHAWDQDAQDDYTDALLDWQVGREVDPSGICDHHERRADG